ncbi:hypothetical protein NDU88_004347 [Pleurodeles waltl]|uniref:Uncharacterized protein n=1 Tax=Pleurodeles waltl TaxID=8319 RepID=A0AAV7TSA8_PLEWA|nr:hypothetical protein NDU88_004347 [Pleurodeles waltl]
MFREGKRNTEVYKPDRKCEAQSGSDDKKGRGRRCEREARDRPPLEPVGVAVTCSVVTGGRAVEAAQAGLAAALLLQAEPDLNPTAWK